MGLVWALYVLMFLVGRGMNSQASIHALQLTHYVFINLHSTKIYCLPDNYEVIDSSLSDIKYALNPTFTKEETAKLDHNTTSFLTVDGSGRYIPGIVGFNDSAQASPINAILQALVRVPMLRDFMIEPANYVKVSLLCSYDCHTDIAVVQFPPSGGLWPTGATRVEQRTDQATSVPS